MKSEERKKGEVEGVDTLRDEREKNTRKRDGKVSNRCRDFLFYLNFEFYIFCYFCMISFLPRVFVRYNCL